MALPLVQPHAWPSLGSLLWLAAGLFLVYRVGLVIYRLFFHPLAKFPGPPLYAASYLPFQFHDKVLGTFVMSTLQLHEKYGPIVRVSPTRLSIDGALGWADVFARRPGVPEFDKFHQFYGLPKPVAIIAAPRDDHRRQRRLLAHAFSEAALQAQEGYLTMYVDLLVQRMRERAAAGEAVDVVRWFNYITFDIIGELAFADPFDSLRNSDYHPWIAAMFSSFKANCQAVFLNEYALLRPLLFLLMGTADRAKHANNRMLSREKTRKRLDMGVAGRKDIMAYVLQNNADGKAMTAEELFLNAEILIMGGSETTATAMSGLVFLLGHNPAAYRILVDEIRSAFASDEDINMKSTARLPYLHAAIEEGMRLYPPASETPPRISPGAEVAGHYIPKGVQLSIYQWATFRSGRNFVAPDRFAPERWLPPSHPLHDERYDADNKAAFKPFTAGPRDCIGKNLAYAEMRLIMARLLWNFDLHVLAGQDDWIASQKVYAIYQKTPLMVRFTPVVREL
ncbi:hypothetical protein SCUCBS95973_001613 [Sporothrix curviconia]|uniref:Cytochrome P450 monooxygenase n=1 Tax=Sporothrix curviconia TaxID=1260050 RepID=A0ABP0B055_9PEZI